MAPTAPEHYTLTISFGREDWPRVARAQGRTYAEIGAYTGKSRATVAAYACGARRPPTDFIAKVWTLLGFPQVAKAA